MAAKITINRSPVLTLWASIVAERLGSSWAEALTLWAVVVAERCGFDWDISDPHYQETSKMLGARSKLRMPINPKQSPDPVCVIR